MNRREAVTTIALGTGGFVVGTGFAAPACGSVSKEKAAKYAGLIIDFAEESVPLLQLLGKPEIATLIDTKAIPALEKLKTALEKADIPTSRSALETVRNVLNGIRTALTNLPESPRLITIIGIFASVNVLLLTVEAFVGSEMPEMVDSAGKAMSLKPETTAEAIKKVYGVSQP